MSIDLDIACGQSKPAGWVGIDIVAMEGVDIVHDLLAFPWPVATGSVRRARCSHFLEHVPARLRPAFFNELWRVLEDGASCEFITPLGLWRQCQDPTHEWPPIVPGTFAYFHHQWLAENNLSHYVGLLGLACNFEVARFATARNPRWADSRGDDDREDTDEFFQNAIDDLMATVIKRPIPE